MAHICAVVNQKGGVGKTTTAVNLAAYLASGGLRVLVIDCDPQGNATSGLGINKGLIGRRTNQPSLYDVLINDTPIGSATLATEVPNLKIVPSHIELAGAEPELTVRIARDTVLKRAIEEVECHYDWILMDAPPSLGLLTINVLAAAHAAIVPIQCEFYALEGVSQLIRTIDIVRKNLNPTLFIGMVVLTMYDSRVRSSQEVVTEVRKAFGDRVSKQIIPRNVRLSEAPSHGQPINLYDPRSRGAAAYKSIAEEIIQRAKTWTG